MNPVDISLYGIIDPEHCQNRPMGELARASADHGVTLIQYRDKVSDSRAMINHANEIRESLQGSGVPFIVNDRVDVALASKADGVHLGQQDMRVKDARGLLGQNAIIGISIKTIKEAEACPVDYIDYAFVGGVFETNSKNNPTAIGMDGWIARANIIKNKALDMPVGAIAGINVSNIASVMEQGCDGVAVISSIYMADDVAAAAQKLAHHIKESRS